MLKRKRAAAPYFKQPVPYNPLTGEHAQLGEKYPLTRIAMMQVIEEDTHDNYVVCRGFDPECGKLFSSINVAKPYSLRGTYPYVVGQVFAAAKPRTLLGDTPGMAETTVGQPADLDETVVILTDDSGTSPIAWLLLDFQTSTIAAEFSLNATTILDTGGSRADGRMTVEHPSTGRFDNAVPTSDSDLVGIENLLASCTTYQAPCLKLKIAGLWKFTLNMGFAAALQTYPTNYSGHVATGTWTSWPWIWTKAMLMVQNGGIGSYGALVPWLSDELRFCNKTGGNPRNTTVVALKNLDADSLIRLDLGATCLNSGDDTTVIDVGGYLTVERLGEQTE